MRNLKRALSLALASVMLLGMMVVGTSAASYPDVDEKDNVEAIEVLNAVKVMIGDRGNFRPDAAVNRHEMAVIMAKLVLGNEAADNYVGSHPFTDVFPWADKYVAACYENGLVSGISRTEFGGNRPLTAVQAAAMMLRALGYEDLSKGATDWRAPVTAAANRIRLFNGVASNPSVQLTRNQVAQLALNTLKSTMVDTKDNSLNISGGSGDNAFTITGGGGREYIVRASADARVAAAISDVESDGSGANGVGGYTLELGEHLYNGDLRLDDDDIDDYGRPARTWEYDGKGVGTYAKTELLRQSYTTKVTGSDMYSLLGNSMVTDANYSLEVYRDGALYTAPAGNAYTNFTKANFTRSNGKTMDNTGRGVLTEVYVDTRDKEITVAIIDTFLAKATSDYSSAREELRVNVYYPSSTVPHTLDAVDFPEITSMKEDDFMLIQWKADSRDNWGTYADYEIADVLPVEILTDKTVTQFSHDNANTTGLVTSLVTDGKTYDANAKLYYDAAELNTYDDSRLTNKTYNVYLDQYGNAIGVDLYSGEDNYVFITGFDLNGSNTATGNATASAIFLDGTMQTIRVNTKDTNDNIKAYNASVSGTAYRLWDSLTEGNATGRYGAKMNTWYTYTQDENSSVYTLKPVARDRQFATALGDGTNPGAGSFEIKSNSLFLSGYNYGEIPYNKAINDATDGYAGSGNKTTHVTRAYGDQKSVFITVGTSEDDQIGEGFYVINEVKSVYTGVQNVSIKSNDIYYKTNDGGTASVTPGENTAEPSIYALIDGNRYVIGAIVIGEDTGSNTDYAYITDYAKNEKKVDGTYYWDFDAVVNGEQKTITLKSNYSNAAQNSIHSVLASGAAGDAATNVVKPYGNQNKGYLFRLSFDKDGYVVDAKPFTDVLSASSAPSTHNGYIYSTDAAVTNWNLRPDGERVRFIKLASGATLTETVNGSSVTTNGQILSIDREGLTLYNDSQSTDIGLAVRADAKVTVIQTIRGDRKVQTYTGLKEAWDYLVDFDSRSETSKNYAGSITAILDSAGRATWLVLDSKGGTGIDQNDEPSGGSVQIEGAREEILAATSGTNKADDQIKNMPDGAFTLPSSSDADVKKTEANGGLAGGLDAGTNVEDVMFFKFTKPDGTQANTSVFVITIVSKDTNKIVWRDQMTCGASATGGAFFYAQVSKGTNSTVFHNSGTGSLATTPLAKGSYTWTVTMGGATVATDDFTIK